MSRPHGTACVGRTAPHRTGTALYRTAPLDMSGTARYRRRSDRYRTAPHRRGLTARHGTVQHQYTLPARHRWARSGRSEVDFLIGDRTVLEYDGQRWHSGADRTARDIRKTNSLIDNGYTVYRIRENTLAHLDLDRPGLVQVSMDWTVDVDRIRTVLSEMLSVPLGMNGTAP